MILLCVVVMVLVLYVMMLGRRILGGVFISCFVRMMFVYCWMVWVSCVLRLVFDFKLNSFKFFNCGFLKLDLNFMFLKDFNIMLVVIIDVVVFFIVLDRFLVFIIMIVVELEWVVVVVVVMFLFKFCYILLFVLILFDFLSLIKFMCLNLYLIMWWNVDCLFFLVNFFLEVIMFNSLLISVFKVFNLEFENFLFLFLVV